jgi:UDPglucose--hexose-1-phosphate uridylyltransferase
VSQLRKCPVSNRWVIIAENRGLRPVEFPAEPKRIDDLPCPLCEGNESHTPGELAAIRKPGTRHDRPGWQVRVVPNKYPALELAGELEPRGDGLYTWLGGVGAHELIVESPRHVVSFSELTADEARHAWEIYRRRMAAARGDDRMAYALVFKNSGASAGATLEHAHSQLIATPVVPGNAREELAGALEYHQQLGACVFCAMIERELADGPLLVEATRRFVAVCPYAARFPCETWILPRRHASHFDTHPEDELGELAGLVQRVVRRVELTLSAPAYNYLVHSAPFDSPPAAHYHWHVEIIPRITKMAGFEWGTGYYINPLPPETAAQRLRQPALAAEP